MIYLDNAATTFPKPNCVNEAMYNFVKHECGNAGRSSHKLSAISSEKIFETRELIANFFNGDMENVVFTLNTTYALNFAIKSLAIDNSHILLSDIEHNSVLRPIYSLCKNNNCIYDTFDSDGTNEQIINNIKKKIKKNTKMLVCTHASNVGCRKLPIKEIGSFCRENQIIFIVDAAQSAGIYDIDVKQMGINALCVPGHKGLYGPQGVGFILFNEIIPKKTIIEGGTGIDSFNQNMPEYLPEMHEAGTMPTPSIVGLSASLKWINTLTIDKIRNHEETLYKLLLDLLKTNEKIKIYAMNDYNGNTLMFNINNISSQKVASQLDNLNICVRDGFHCSPLAHRKLSTGKNGAIRVGISIFNTKLDIYSLYDALMEIIISNKI
ncbi:MAG: aminotransferase class V-fold PLP-dependent enzyme [Clostridia bacterium]|nr:aminotransferase class V-fold PLP-dependent enzyme [Clostridia bacterium]